MALELLVVGGGKMGAALLGGLVRSGWAEPSALGVIEPVASLRAELEAAHPGLTVLEAPAPDLLARSGGAVLAVKPDQAEAACRSLVSAGLATRVLSVAAGVPTARLEAVLGQGSVVLRAMPNTAALVGAGVAGLSGGSQATSADLAWAEGVLAAVGTVVRLPERLLDAVTGLSGSGPAYVFVVAEALIEAGVAMGLGRRQAHDLTVGTLAGAARLLQETGEDPAALRAAVTSPAGTTAAGLRALESRAVRSAFIEAVAAATERSRSLSR